MIETFTSTINPGDTVIYNFNTTADLSTDGVYNIDKPPPSKECIEAINLIPPTLRKLFKVDKIKTAYEELKERHLNVIHLADLHRFQSLNNAKEALEKAFTPHLKKMLEESKND